MSATAQPKAVTDAAARKRPRAADAIARGRASSPWMSSEEAAGYLGLPSVGALYHLLEDHHDLPYGRVGRSYRFHRDQLDRWIERRSPSVLRRLGVSA